MLHDYSHYEDLLVTWGLVKLLFTVLKKKIKKRIDVMGIIFRYKGDMSGYNIKHILLKLWTFYLTGQVQFLHASGNSSFSSLTCWIWAILFFSLCLLFVFVCLFMSFCGVFGVLCFGGFFLPTLLRFLTLIFQ